MLILTRRMGDSVVIKHPAHGDIVVTYLSMQGPNANEIRVGFDAPKDVNIVRSEILDRYPNDPKEKNRGTN